MDIWKSKRVGEPLNRREFFARLRSLGFKRSPMQVTRAGVTYYNANLDIMVTLPRHHEKTVMVTAPKPQYRGLTGIFVAVSEDTRPAWGKAVRPSDLRANDCSNLMEVIVRILDKVVSWEAQV